LNVVLTAVGGAAGKLLARYGLKPMRLKALGERLWNLGGKLKDAVGTWMRSRKTLDRAEAAAPGCNSFVPGTLVLLADGSSKPIEDLDVGDLVVASDPESGETAAKAVVATIVGHGVKDLVEITVDTDGGRGDAEGVVVATDGHPFWVPEVGEWLDAAELEAGQWLRTSAGTWVQVTAVRQWSETRTVHNLTIDDIHTYHVLAGTTSVLVHNENTNPFPERDLRKLRDEHGRPLPDVDAPHSQLGRNNLGKPSEYNAAHEFDEDGRLVRQIHWSDHSDPSVHTNPHQHPYDPVTGKRGGVSS